jgi:hypothetical protein
MTLSTHFDSYRHWRDGVGRSIERLRGWLADADLLDSQAEQRLARLAVRLVEDRLVVAFVAEFSRGKSELINALFFADRGGRILPSSAGRTTMCPAELAWDRSLQPRIALLPIETRAEGASLSDLRRVPDAWQVFPFDPDFPEAMSEALRRVGEVKHVSTEVAQSLGFAIGDAAEGDLQSDENGLVEIPRWRHALINIPHPLLEQGLVVLDTPGLNAIGAEPELTLSLLPGAHAVLFILAADTGVTQTDLAIWRDYVGGGAGRLVVLNKIDGLWDGLRAEAEIQAEIDRQVVSCAHILNLPAANIFPVSAQKALVAKVNGDVDLLARSCLPRLEQALAEGLLPAKREVVAKGTAGEALAVAAEVRGLLDTRLNAFSDQLAELDSLRGKNQNVVSYMMRKAKVEKEAFEKGLRDYYAVRSVFTHLADTLFVHLGLDALRRQGRKTRDAMRQAAFTPQLLSAMGELFLVARANMAQSELDITEIDEMMTAMRERFVGAHSLHLESTAGFNLGIPLRDLDRLEEGFRRQFGSLFSVLTKDKRALTQQFFETVASQMRKIFDAANRDAEQWLRSLMAPLEGQVREVRRQLKHRLENVQRIHEAADSLKERIDELAHAKATVAAQLNELEELEAVLEAALRPPTRPALRAVA